MLSMANSQQLSTQLLFPFSSILFSSCLLVFSLKDIIHVNSVPPPLFHSIFSLHFILGYFHDMPSKPVVFMASQLMSLSEEYFILVTWVLAFSLDFIL